MTTYRDNTPNEEALVDIENEDYIEDDSDDIEFLEKHNLENLSRTLKEPMADHGYDTRVPPTSSQTVLFVIWCAILIVSCIWWGFNFNMLENRLIKQEQFLKSLNYRHLYIQADLIQHEKFSTIQNKAERFGLNLELSTVPPYELHISEKTK